eukprot:3159770-Rhodomonas_salina.2
MRLIVFDFGVSRATEHLRLDYALSREGQVNKKGGKMYIQDKVEEYADEVFQRLDQVRNQMQTAVLPVHFVSGMWSILFDFALNAMVSGTDLAYGTVGLL